MQIGMIKYVDCRWAQVDYKSGLKVKSVIIAILLFLPGIAYPCDTLQECLAALETTAKPGKGIGKGEQALAKQILPYGAEAVPGLMEALKGEDEEVRDLAGFIISGIDGVTAEHLPALIESRNGWVMSAIARIGNDDAIKYIMAEFDRERSWSGVSAGAIKILGTRALPYLINYFTCNHDCDETVLYAAARILGDMGDDALGAVPELKKIAFNPDSDAIVREAAQNALIEIGAPEAVDLLVHRLRKLPDRADIDTEIEAAHLLGNLSSMGTVAMKSGELIQERVHSQDRTIKILAARALGYIGYKKAIPELLEMVGPDSDYLEVYVATESLGRLKAESALKSLVEIRENYWYPPVREAAGKAVRAIRGEYLYEEVSRESFYPWEFLSHEWAGQELSPCKSTDYEFFEYVHETKFYSESDKAFARQFTYKTVTESYGAEGYVESRYDYAPDVGLKLEEGWLLGGDRGEWGGELVYWESRNDSYTLLRDNIQDIFITPDGIFAVGGLAHLTTNRGVLYRISKSADGKFIAEPYKYLPAASYSNHMLKDGRLLLNTLRGSVLFSSITGFEMAKCSN